MAEQNQDWVAETQESIKARLEAVKASQAQTRVTLGGMAIISAMMLIALYNAYFSYDYRYITTNLRRTLGSSNIPDVLMGQAARDWTSARTIQISLLGIRVSVDDAAVLGTAVLTILSFWLVLVTRRENHSLGLLLRDTDARQAGAPTIQTARWLILHTIAANALFETTHTSLDAIRTLRGPNPLAQARKGFRHWASERSMSFLRKFFFVFPVVTSVLVFAVDRYSYFIADPFNPNGTPAGSADPFFWPSMVPYFACLIPLVLACLKANDFSLATESVLREYSAKLFRDLVPETERRRSDRFVIVDAR